MTLKFPETSEDLGIAFNNARARGVFSDDPNQKTFWAKHELMASDLENGAVVADWFLNIDIKTYLRVPRKELSE